MAELHLRDVTVRTAIDTGIDHAWQWFSLHASQRLLAVDFFLVASAFLSAAYVSALHYSYPAVAFGIGVVGVWSTLCFSRFEIRVRELLKASERALYPLQRMLANETGVPELNLCERIEVPTHRFTSYNKVIKALHWATGGAFTAGAFWALNKIWAGHAHSLSGTEALILVYHIAVLLSGVTCIYFACKIALADRLKLTWFHCILAVAFAAVGLVVVALSAIHSL